MEKVWFVTRAALNLAQILVQKILGRWYILIDMLRNADTSKKIVSDNHKNRFQRLEAGFNNSSSSSESSYSTIKDEMIAFAEVMASHM